MSYRISLLDKSPVAKDETPGDALKHTLRLAQLAEEWGYHRFWIAEHHNTSRLASPSPELLIAWVAGQTQRIRVGSGGVMLQHYSPYKVAENFNLLANLAPGRIDLGVGKAPGGLPLSTQALQRGAQDKETFAEKLTQLDNWLSLPAGEDAEETLRATPVPAKSADRFLLGASLESAALAANLNWNFVYAAHLNGDKTLMREVLNAWRDKSQRDTLVAVQVIVAADAQKADELASLIQIWSVELENAQRVSVVSEEQAHVFARQAGSAIKKIERREPSLLKGTAETVRAGLAALSQEFGIDEFIIDTPIADPAARFQSLRLLAGAQAVKSVADFAAEHEAW
jgi:luciferase family oxidoreductase group 1